MSNHFYAMMSRMKNIYRWGLMRNTRQENLSEHTLEVAFIAHALALIHNHCFGGNVDANTVAVSAMFHDTSEIITGDMPTPIKYYNANIKNIYKEIEGIAEDRLINLLPDYMRDDLKVLYNPDKQTQIFIKAADKISALIKCIEEKNSGNQEFASAEQATLKVIKSMNLPEADMFLDEFLNSYSLTLDELK